MTVGGGDGPIAPSGVVEGLGAVEPAPQVEGIGATQELERIAGASAVAPSSAAPSVDVVDQISADFSAGRIDRTGAIEALVEIAMPAHVDGASRVELKAMMLELAESDAYLQQLIARLEDKR